MERGALPCFECLKRSIESDIPADIVCRYGISDSALPFGSSAVVQIYQNGIADNIENEDVLAQFVLVQLHNENNSSFSNHYLANGVGNNAHRDFSSLEREHMVAVDDESLTTRSFGSISSSRIIAALAPVGSLSQASYATINDLLCKYFSGSLEGHVMSSLNLFAKGKLVEQPCASFLSLIGFPSFSVSSIPSHVRHPNISPSLGIVGTSGYNYFLQLKAPYTLENILHYSPNALKSDWHIRFLVYQILSALAYMHGLGIAHGNLCPSCILLTDSCWAWLSISSMRLLRGDINLKETTSSLSRVCCCMDHYTCHCIYADMKLSDSLDWHSHFKQWWMGELSNYEYLLVLNRLAGRRWGDHTFHTVMPWVIDFSVRPDENSDTGWRDLTKSKWRLAKGDEQLDFTFQTSEVPHHISDEILSELAVCSYKARRLPLRILRSAVRSVYEPNEYPANMQRLYQWTPDECIPEFYSDPNLFISLHSEMSDLAVPSWASSPEEFVSLHRDALESEHVSRQIHHWIDITFGYKLSGEASISAKNVMLPTSDPLTPKSMGRRQLFTRPHPIRRGIRRRTHWNRHREDCVSFLDQESKNKLTSSVSSGISSPLILNLEENLLADTSYMEHLEEAISFCEHASYLSPIYNDQEHVDTSYFPQIDHNLLSSEPNIEASLVTPDINLCHFLESLEADDSGSVGFQELLHWRNRLSSWETCSKDLTGDIFSIGCILAELYLKRPLFDPVSLAAYRESGVLPDIVHELPPHVAMLVEACIHRDWKRRPSAKFILESQYFPPTVRSAYLFLSPLHVLGKSGHRLHYAAKLASEGALKAMGAHAAEMCIPYCLPLMMSPLSDVETGSALCLLQEFLKCLNPHAIKTLLLPVIQKIIQASEYSHLKVSILQDSFVRDIWAKVGKQAYLEKIHPLVISNLFNSPNKASAAAAAASVVLIGSSEELGIPITVQQTILPIIHSFGKGLCADGIDALVRIGAHLGENFIVKQILPLLRNAVLSCIDASHMNKPEPLHSWISLALIDSFSTLDGLVTVLPIEVVLKELIQDHICLHVKVLMQSHMDLHVLQVAATTLISICQRIGPDFTISHVMPQLKELFDELVFHQAAAYGMCSSGKFSKVPKSESDGVEIENRMDLVFLLYPSLQSIMGMEKLRQCCSTWFLLEQILQKFYNWKWESAGETSRSSGDSMNAQRLYFGKISASEYNPAKLLLNGVGWSIPQSQGNKAGITMIYSKQANERQQSLSIKHRTTSILGQHEPWFWYPSADANCDGPDFLGRSGGLKDELPWKIKASILYSARAHPGALRSLAVALDECTVYTGGVGPGFKGSVQKWELPGKNCISGYYGHDEVVNDICILSMSGRVASCDGTIHVWNGQTGKLIAAYAESSTTFPQHGLQLAAKMATDQTNMLTPNALSSGILSNAFSGSLYTCMHHLESEDKLVAGMGNGSVRFIDVLNDRKLHLWKSSAAEYSFSSLVSAICSCGSEKFLGGRTVTSPSLIAAAQSSGHCRLLDARSGNVVALWRAHDGYITKLAAPEEHLLVSSSLDKTMRVWDLRRNLESQTNIYRGHPDGISSFCVWGHDVISVSRNKIALTSLSRSTDNQGGQQRLSPQNLYSADRGTRNLSVLSTICVLPFSRLFLVGTEDGHLKICN